MAKDPTRTKRTYPFQMFAVPRERVVRIHASSGTTGKPTVVGYTQADDTWAHLVARSIRASGGRTGTSPNTMTPPDVASRGTIPAWRSNVVSRSRPPF